MTYHRLDCATCRKELGVYPDEIYATPPLVYCSSECWSSGPQTVLVAVNDGNPTLTVEGKAFLETAAKSRRAFSGIDGGRE